MANFFKEYHAELKAERKATEKKAKEDIVEYKRGQVVYIKPFNLLFDDRNARKRYFADYLSDHSVLLAETKKEALDGYGHIHSIYDIEK